MSFPSHPRPLRLGVERYDTNEHLSKADVAAGENSAMIAY